jgi:hypothetical protein
MRKQMPACFLRPIPNPLWPALFNLIYPIVLAFNAVVISILFTENASCCQIWSFLMKEERGGTIGKPVSPQSRKCRAEAAVAALRKRKYGCKQGYPESKSIMFMEH